METSNRYRSLGAWTLAASLVAAGWLPSQGFAQEPAMEEAALVAIEETAANEVSTELSTIDDQVTPSVDYTTPLGALEAAQSAAPGDDFDSDPWEPFNDKMFWFNREVLDRFLLKPLATAWDFITPDVVQRGVRNMFDNLEVVRRVVNNSLQAKFGGAGIELARFSINSTIGVLGFFDVAKDGFGIEQRDEDTGQTFGTWGMGPGPYLVLPFLPPLNVRDGIGLIFDRAMFPPSYFMPFWGSIVYRLDEGVNDRSLNLDRFERVAESTVDLYSAVRNGYLQRRAAAIRQ